MNQECTPLLTRLEALAAGERLSFHMPANRGGKSFPERMGRLFSCLESTELAVTDDLNRPEGPAREAERLAAECFGAGESLFFTSGSTTAIYAMLTAAAGAGGRILADPCAHRSLAQIAALLDLELDFLPLSPVQGSRSPLPKPDPEALERLLSGSERGRWQALYLSSPDYYGCTAEVGCISGIAKRHGLLLLCDEAHGAAFAASEGMMPPTALSAGADLVVQSLHKTLPALAPASILHLSEGALKRFPGLHAAALRARPLFQTSSPSFPVAASIDYARRFLALEGREHIRELIAMIRETGENLPDGMRLLPALEGREDPTRVVIDCSGSGLSALQIAAALSERGVDVEMADFTRLILIPSLDQPREDFLRLSRVLREMAPGLPLAPHADSGPERRICERLSRPRLSLKPRAALFKGFRGGPAGIEDAILAREAGKRLIASACISPYPPGIPLFYPGEELSADDLLFLEHLLDEGFIIPDCGRGRFPILIQ